MAKKKSNKIQERKVEIPRGEPLQAAIDEVKKVSGFNAAVVLRGKLLNKATIEYEFLVGDSETELQTEFLRRQKELMEAS